MTLVAPVALVALALGCVAHASGDRQPIGNWRFKAVDRPVKAVIVGGSVAAWPRGGFGQFIQAVCPRVEVKNRAKAKLGAKALKVRFERQVVRNRRVDLASHESTWLIFMGGLNSVGTPKMTNRHVASTLKRARERGFKTLALTVGPWGAEHDKRWRGASGNRYQDKTRLTVDFLMGRLTPKQAFGRSAHETFLEGQRPDVVVDLYDSGLRNAQAELREEAPNRRRLRYDKEFRRTLKKLPQEEAESVMERSVQQALEMPRWFMRKELQAFDHIHPNMEGHRVIAQTLCPSLPKEWACQCDRLSELTWEREQRGLTPVVERAPQQDSAPPPTIPVPAGSLESGAPLGEAPEGQKRP
jgi:hypothetical protein